MAPSAGSSLADASVSATVTAEVSPPRPPPIEVTSPRYRVTGGAVVSPGATAPSAGAIVGVPSTGTLTVGLVPFGLGSVTTVQQTVLVPGATVDSTPFGATVFALSLINITGPTGLRRTQIAVPP